MLSEHRVSTPAARQRVHERLILAVLLLMTALVLTIGITWGLPSRSADAFLFGDRRPWTGTEILALTPQRSGSAADVDVNPVARGGVLNGTDARRAEIVRRYRLYTYQPDEMITMMSLAQMRPSRLDLDPRLYQYGGLWIYPVGGLIKLLLQPRNDQAYYLDHPEEFAKFYIVARAYSAAWGVVGAWAVYRLARRWSRNAAILATLLYATMPVVVNQAHEAKPHLAGTTLMLLAALAARNYIERGCRQRLIWISALCGAAAGTVLSAIIAPVIAIAAIVLRVKWESAPFAPVKGRAGGVEGSLCDAPRVHEIGHARHPDHRPPVRERGDRSAAFRLMARVAASLIVSAAVYAITNPYVVKHLLLDRSVLTQNVGNTGAMYRIGGVGGLGRGAALIAAGAGWTTLSVFGVAAIAGGTRCFRAGRREIHARWTPLWPLLGCAAVNTAAFVLLAAGKPGEFGRFGLLTDVALVLVAGVATTYLRSRSARWMVAAILMVGALVQMAPYLRGFRRDSGDTPGRLMLAQELRERSKLGLTSLAVPDEPAPYLMPPVDLWHWQIVLLPRAYDLATLVPPARVVVRPEDRPTERRIVGAYHKREDSTNSSFLTPSISWADKPIEVWIAQPH